MKRRQSFLKITFGVMASIGFAAVSTCRLLADHFSSYSWPSYPKEGSLRSHLLTKPHYLKKAEVDAMTFVECREFHDKHHAQTGGKPPSSSRLWMNDVYEKPETPVIDTDAEYWKNPKRS